MKRFTVLIGSLAMVVAVLPIVVESIAAPAVAQTCPEPTLAADDPRAQWVEGTMAQDDGATRDFYNRAAGLAWDRPFGDIVDVNGWPSPTAPYSVLALEDDDTPGPHGWDVIAAFLVRALGL